MSKGLNLEDLIRLYETIKRDQVIYGYNVEKEAFVKITDTIQEKINADKANIIPFINCYDVCLDIIKAYLSQENISKYRDGAIKEMQKNKHKKIVAFLWYFEHIDGAYGFGEFENHMVRGILKKWAKESNIQLSDV